MFKKAKQAAPTVIFLDEIDAIAGTRGVEMGTKVSERVLNQLLTEMDGLEELHNVLVIAATNRPDIVDPGLLRPGRFDKILLIRAPDEKARLEIFKVHTSEIPLDGDVDLQELATRTENYSGADIEALAREAGILAIREAVKYEEDFKEKLVEKKHFEKALKKVRPSLTPEIIQTYEDFLKRYESRELEKLVYTA